MSTKSLCFSVDGAWLADFARTRFDEGAWDRAIALLTDSLDGLSTDQAIAIVKGEATLQGNSSDKDGISYVTLPVDGELAVRMRERTEFLYGGMFRMGDTIWKPYAIVSGWCKDDYEFSRKFTGTQHTYGGRGDRLSCARSLYYANSPEKDMLVQIPERYENGIVIADVLCERFTGSLPMWYRVSTENPITFIENLLDTKKLELRGAFRTDDTPTKIEESIKKIVPNAALPEDHQVLNEQVRKSTAAELFANAEEFFASPYTLKELGDFDMLFERAVDALHSSFTNEQWDKVDFIRESIQTREVELLREQIIAQATVKGGFIDMILRTGRMIRVPRNPFILWCFRGPWRSNSVEFERHGKEYPDWSFVCKSGMKMYGDDPAHSDWVIGAGLSLKDAYDHSTGSLGELVNDAAYELKHKLVTEYTGHAFTVLAKNKDVTYISGDVVFPKPGERVRPGSIAVVPHAGPEYQMAMETACMETANGRRGAIICEVGGKLAHLALVGREFGCTVLMLPNAMSIYKEGDMVAIDINTGTIESQVL